MTYYMLPKTPQNICDHINIEFIEDEPETIISFSLSNYLSNVKEKITEVERVWSNYKKYTNPYEFIHTVIPGKHKSICKYKPLSRSYFKMHEILNIFNLHVDPHPIQSFHLAEGPGGFIESLLNIRKNIKDKYYGMTIIDENEDDYNIPSWKKSKAFLKNNPNVKIEYGATQTGDLLNIDNFNHCYEKYGGSMNIVTGDGGFDFSENFNNQENQIVKLLFGQICYALIMQKKGGSFVLKIFDCFLQHSIDLLYLLTAFYGKVYIVKPHTSRYANSEKYIVCKNFNFTGNVYQLLHEPFKTSLNNNHNIKRFLDIDISSYFLNKFQEYNAIFGQQQLENIAQTLYLIYDNDNKNDKIINYIKNNILKCIQWCNKYNIETNVIPGILPYHSGS
jgi:23S rRNA U2552 (ribose-2'-O)-methylase RlmE/FtsJ